MDQVGTVSDAILALFKIEYLLLFADLLIIVFLLKLKNFSTFFRIRLNLLFILPIIVFFIVIGFLNANKTISEIIKYEKLGAIGYQFLVLSSDIESIITNGENIAAELLKIRNSENGTEKLKGIAKDKHVIIVQLESIQEFIIHLKIDNQEVTPVLNNFLKETYYFPHVYTQVGKGNTSDAEFIVNTSIFAVGDEAMSSVIEGKDVPSLPKLLKERGYHTSTYHSNTVTFWNRKEMYESLGFDEYFDKEYFGKEDIISYGASDEVLYKKTVDKLREHHQNGTKVYANIIAMSSHFPFNIPDDKKQYAINLPSKYDGSIVGSYIEAVSYADYAFGVLLAELKKSGLYEDSIIVVYGDHQGVQMKNDVDRELVRELVGGEYHSVLDHLNVPLMIKIPSMDKGETIETVGGLVDIYPTLANLLDVNIKEEIVFGRDLFNSTNNIVGIRFYAPTGTYVTRKYSFAPGVDIKSGTITTMKDRNVKEADNEALALLEQLLEYQRMSDTYVKTLDKNM